MKNTFNEIIKSIFERALELDKLSREVFLNSLEDHEKEYKDEVKSLLRAYEKNSDFLEIDDDRTIFSEDNIGPHPLIGKHIGSYLIEEEVGIGGMGIVFIGKRDDQEFEQKVAIKILKQGLSSEYLVKRFQNERQTLANLQHPNIAKLFDGGKTEEGLPYLVMEYIDGVTVTQYCEQNNLTIDERLNLFRTVCNAVQHAHQNLIIHRDIKPGNILVNKEGRVKLLDFGVAKLLDEDLQTPDEDLTKTGMWHLTPEFASPEQINGENITTVSDIYSLGVLLYKLLSGQAPYKIYNSSPLAISRILEKEKIAKPSEIIQKATQNAKSSIDNVELHSEFNRIGYRQLVGDLDNIVLKAMHIDPAHRYTSVQELDNDIGRYLTGLPVIARKDTFFYRASKFIKRHKIGVAIFIFVNIIILASIAAIVYQARMAAVERDKAKVENAKFEKVNSFLQGILSSVDPSEIGRDVKVYDVLEQAAEDVETELKDQPGVEAAIRSTLGNTYVNLGEYDKGKPFLVKSYNINKNLYGEESRETAENIHDLALYYDWIGEYKIADSLYDKSIKLFRKVLTEPTKIFADALNNHGIIKMNFSMYDEAEKLYLEAIENSIITQGVKNRNTAVMMNNIAINYMDAGNLDRAEKYYKKSLGIILEILGENRPETGSSYNNIARLYIIKSEFDSAEVYLQKSYELKYNLKGKDHPDVGLALNNLGVLQFRRNNYPEAEKFFTDAIAQYRKTYDPLHPLIAVSNFWLGRICLETNRFERGEYYLRKCLQTRVAKMPKDNWEVILTKGELGICLLNQKRYAEAEPLIKNCYQYFSTKNPSDNQRTIRFLTNIVKLYRETNNKAFSEYKVELDSLMQL